MPRPSHITNEDILRWSDIIDNDPMISSDLAQNPIIREVCYAGRYMAEKLEELECPDHLIGQLMYAAGGLCFGRDPWEVHREIIGRYIDGTLEFDLDMEDAN